jgi:hypothetical protein
MSATAAGTAGGTPAAAPAPRILTVTRRPSADTEAIAAIADGATLPKPRRTGRIVQRTEMRSGRRSIRGATARTLEIDEAMELDGIEWNV